MVDKSTKFLSKINAIYKNTIAIYKCFSIFTLQIKNSKFHKKSLTLQNSYA